MSRIYAIREDTGKKVLVALQYDKCSKKIKPNPDIEYSGWTRRGTYVFNDPGKCTEYDYCDECSQEPDRR